MNKKAYLLFLIPLASKSFASNRKVKLGDWEKVGIGEDEDKSEIKTGWILED